MAKRKNKNFEIIEKKTFWKKYDLDRHPNVQIYYIAIKDLLRFNLIVKLNKVFINQLIVVGDKWKPYIKSSLKNNYNTKYVSSLYKGNICLDFGSKWGSNSLYPRAVDIIESGGLLLQSKQSDSKKIYNNHYSNMSFNNFNEMSKKIRDLLKNNHKIKNLFADQCKIFEDKNLNYNTLKNIFLISKRNN